MSLFKSSSSINPEFIVQTVANTVKLVRINVAFINGNFDIVKEADAVISQLVDMIPYGKPVDLQCMTGLFYSKVNKACTMASPQAKKNMHAARWDIDNFRTKIAQNPKMGKRLLFLFCDAYLSASDEHYTFIFDIQMKTITVIEALAGETAKLLGTSGLEAMADTKVDAIQKEVDKLQEFNKQLKELQRNPPQLASVVPQ